MEIKVGDLVSYHGQHREFRDKVALVTKSLPRPGMFNIRFLDDVVRQSLGNQYNCYFRYLTKVELE